ncbi:transcription factor 25 [Elysia marginata]|uniref:Transcription factor 25 n=1 Tax=Elysia marginata TaxID=1093978 RepID=A0AAV4GB15_9GAST|nr:transcription factor 25 [Elysia marginata]
MSSRALRRLQKDSGIGLSFPEDEEKEDFKESSMGSDHNGTSLNNLQKKKKKGKVANVPVNPFELLNNGLEDPGISSEGENDEDKKMEKAEFNMNKDMPKTKKKKKQKRKQKTNENTAPDAGSVKDPEDEIEASIQEVNRILGEANTSLVHTEKGQDSKSANMKSLLHIDHRNLNPETELVRIFGSQVVRGEQRQDRYRRQRNRPVQRSSKLVQPKENWHHTGGSGLSMTYLGEEEGFKFEHSPTYQKQQFEFYDAVESGHPEAIASVLRKQPYHIDSLIQISDFHRINEDFQVAAEFIEKAIYGMECAFHSRFNIAAGNCYLPYNRPENRALYLCIFKHIMHLGRRGCNRTAFEFCKLLLSLDPTDDPLDCMSMIDFYALRSDQHEYLLRLEKEGLSHKASKGIPNFAFSIALAHFKDALKKGCDTKAADEWLQDALIFFPVMLIPLLDQCSVQPDKRVSSHPFFNSKELLDMNSELGRLVTLYVKRCESCWKEMEVMSWLERNVLAVLDIVDNGSDKRIKEYAELRKKGFKKPPLSLLRHYFLSEIQGVSPPQRFASGSVLGYDPFPPPGSIASYTRPPSVNALMDAMRQLLNDPFAAHQQNQQMPAEGEEEVDNEGEWEEEERLEDENNQR